MLLVVSIDGLMPQAITPERMPNLVGLARSGAACFEARTVSPPVTLPAHLSMTRGVDPAVHGVIDNTPPDVVDGLPSFMALASRAGLRTAAVFNWSPFELLFEHGTVDTVISIDGGYDPAEDLQSAAAAEALLSADDDHDVVFAYLAAPDLAGHDHGWASDGYLAAVVQADECLGRLIAATSNRTSIVVTTDHGGHDRTHDGSATVDFETFVVLRSPGINAGSMWSSASILDIAPTIADLLDFEPAPGWVGRSLIGVEVPVVDVIMAYLSDMATVTYGESLDMLSHSLQTAAQLQLDRGDSAGLAGLLHDLGHQLPAPEAVGEWGRADHAATAGRWLSPWLPAAIVEPIKLHVDAKRWLVATDQDYAERLSHASTMTLADQGGPFDAVQAEAFAQQPFAAEAIRLRRCDDEGKKPGLVVAPLSEWRARLAAALAGMGDSP